MKKAALALIITIAIGLLVAIFAFENMDGFSELGSIAAIAVMGFFIILFNEKKPPKE